MQVLQNLMGLLQINLLKARWDHVWNNVIYKLVKITQPFLAFKKNLEMVKDQLDIPIYLIYLST